jgi:large subunit ribosomal protein L24
MKREIKKGAIKSRIKRGDDVVFVAGKEFNRYDSEGKRNPYRGKVIAVDASTGRVKVDGAMIVKKHRKAVPQMNVEGGIIKKEAWVDVSNLAVVDPDTGKPSRIRYEIRDGAKVRIAKSGAVIPEPSVYARVETKDVTEEEAVAVADAAVEVAEEPVEESVEEIADEAKADEPEAEEPVEEIADEAKADEPEAEESEKE